MRGLKPRAASSNKGERNSIAAGLKRAGRGGAQAIGQGAGEEEWMITYTDLVTLLLTLFVILISLASFDPTGDDPGQEVGVMEGSRSPIVVEDPKFGISDIEETAPEDPRDAVSDEQLSRLAELQEWSDRVSRLLQYHLEQNALTDGVELQVMDYQVIMHMRDRILFPSGSADLAAAGRDVLAKLISALAFVDSRIDVEGHTDSVPISSTVYPSNWELSAARASAVVRFLVDAGMPRERLRAVGFADTKPQAPNNTFDGRARNRRVSLVVVPEVDIETGRLVTGR
jgi:chemotaxis protein MotB